MLFTPLAPYETPSAIDAICKNYNRMIENQELDTILLIPIFIHDFLCIHPFSDGNGRMSRLLIALLIEVDMLLASMSLLKARLLKIKICTTKHWRIVREVGTKIRRMEFQGDMDESIYMGSCLVKRLW